jgi:hypothetical protein
MNPGLPSFICFKIKKGKMIVTIKSEMKPCIKWFWGVLLTFTLNLFTVIVNGQEIPQPVSNAGIYEFLDELASLQLITINSAVKPYSRLFIAKCLSEAEKSKDKLSDRQMKELNFYLWDFGKEIPSSSVLNNIQGKARWLKGIKEGVRFDLFSYRDSLFQITVNPILGGEFFRNASGNATYARNGLEARAYVGHWGFYASLRDNHEKPLLGLPQYLSQRIDGHIKGGSDWSDMQGGITYSWKWGSAGLVKDNLQWGSNYHGANIFGGNNPSFVQLRLHLNPVKWLEFNYFHGWLNSMVVDSTKSFWVTNSYGTSYRDVYHSKFIAANMFTFYPVRDLALSAGNSIVYDYGTLNPAYLVPLFFYKSVDHSLSSGIDNMNSQMFFDISSRQIKYLHLYASLFIDELSVPRLFKRNEWNFVSWKTGFRLIDFPITNLSLTSEFTYTYPLTYQHYIPTITFESNNFNLGHYLRDNARELFISLDYKPLRAMDLMIYYNDAARGPDYTELGTPRLGNPPLKTIAWHSTVIGLSLRHQVINDLYVWGTFTISNISGDTRWSPSLFYGKKNTINLGFTYGF